MRVTDLSPGFPQVFLTHVTQFGETDAGVKRLVKRFIGLVEDPVGGYFPRPG